MAIYGATSRLSKLQSNVIVHVAVSLFIENLSSELHLETTANVVGKIEGVMCSLSDRVGISTILSFLLDSFSDMKNVRKQLKNKRNVKCANVCASHCLKILSLDDIKNS